MSRNSAGLFTILFIIIIFSLIAALIPVLDVDNDGFLDSLVIDGFLLLPALFTITGLYCLLTRLLKTCFAYTKWYFFLIVPPPIPN